MGISQLNLKNVEVRLAKDKEEIRAAQHLRYRVFYEEYKAIPDEETAREKRDFDHFDPISDHLVVIDRSIDDPDEQIVGTYRMLRQEMADKHGSFYTSEEYDLTPLMNCGQSLLELGRSCVLADYRTRPVLQMLWEGIVDYLLSHNVGLMFGCASFHGTDIDALSRQLSYLYHYHLAPPELRPRALEERYVDMNIIPREEIEERTFFNELPALIKGYIRLGAYIGDGAVIDHQFNTTDVCIVLPTKKVSARYRRHYARKINRLLPGPLEESAEKVNDNYNAMTRSRA